MKNKYLEDPQRLGNVIAAIQAMALYKFYKLDFAAWADRIAGPGASLLGAGEAPRSSS